MFAIIRRHCSSILPASALAGIALLGVLGAAGTEAPATRRPVPVTALRSDSGKIVDRLPGSAPAVARFSDISAAAEWSMAALPGGAISLASLAGSDIGGTGQAAFEPVAVAAARPAAVEAKPARTPARPRREPVVTAALPPPRPLALRLPESAVAIEAAPDKRPSVTARMIAFVGSLASLARPL